MIPRLFIFLLSGLRPFLGPATCKFSLSCTRFAINQLQTEPLHKALWAIVKRLLKCNPFYTPKDSC